jgi:hypothetical protein
MIFQTEKVCPLPSGNLAAREGGAALARASELLYVQKT